MKKFFCNLIVPAVMFAGILSLPLWADKNAEHTPSSSYENSDTQAPAQASREIVVGAAAAH